MVLGFRKNEIPIREDDGWRMTDGITRFVMDGEKMLDRGTSIFVWRISNLIIFKSHVYS